MIFYYHYLYYCVLGQLEGNTPLQEENHEIEKIVLPGGVNPDKIGWGCTPAPENPHPGTKLIRYFAT